MSIWFYWAVSDDKDDEEDKFNVSSLYKSVPFSTVNSWIITVKNHKPDNQLSPSFILDSSHKLAKG